MYFKRAVFFLFDMRLTCNYPSQSAFPPLIARRRLFLFVCFDRPGVGGNEAGAD